MNEYPTEEELKKIKNWKGSFKGLWEYITDIWHWGDSMYKIYKYGGKYRMEIHTGGWSGNEDIIEAWEHSKCLFFFISHTKWLRGGHYYFEFGKDIWENEKSLSR